MTAEDHVLRVQVVMITFRIREKQILIAEDNAVRVLQVVMITFRIREKHMLIAEDHAVRVLQVVMIKFRIREKQMLIAEDHVLRAPLVKMVFRIKEKLELIAEDHVLKNAKVWSTCCNDISIVRRVYLPYLDSIYKIVSKYISYLRTWTMHRLYRMFFFGLQSVWSWINPPGLCRNYDL